MSLPPLHRIWFNTTGTPPPSSVDEAHRPLEGKFDFRMYDLSDFRKEFSREIMDLLLNMWPGDWYRRYKAMSDLLRYRKLYQEGGLYLDLDNLIVGDIQPLLDTDIGVCTIEARIPVQNSVLWAKKPGEQIWETLITESIKNLQEMDVNTRPMWVTGPKLVVEHAAAFTVKTGMLGFEKHPKLHPPGSVILSRYNWIAETTGGKDGIANYGKWTMVTGLPSGGTSAVAGFLHYLGCSMGVELCQRKPGRKYPSFEDLKFNRSCNTKETDRVVNLMSKYMKARRGHAGHVGVKWPWLTRIADIPEPVLMRLREAANLVVVNRPFDETLESYRRREPYERLGRGATPEETPLYTERMAELQELKRRWTPTLEVPYNHFRERPHEYVEPAVEALGLHPPLAEQVDRAVRFVTDYRGLGDAAT